MSRSKWIHCYEPILAALVVFLSGTPAKASIDSAAIRLAAPAPGAVLEAGDRAVLQWTAGALPAGAEEWEAFLSLDGGRTYPYRITPHLSSAIRRFEFSVPELCSEQASILLRIGDERSESEYPFAARFSIRGMRPVLGSARRSLSAVRGEAARSGFAPTVAWVEGRRDGSGLREVAATEFALGAAAPPELQAGVGATDIDAPPDPVSQLARLPPDAVKYFAAPRAGSPSATPLPPPSSSDRLARLSRRNE